MHPIPPPCDVVTVTLNPAIDRTITIPQFRAGRVNRAGPERSGAAGKGINVASVLADYSVDVIATGFLGRSNPVMFEQLFERKKIGDQMVRINGETRTSIKILDPELHQTTDINFPGPEPTPEDREMLEQKLEQLVAPVYVLSGSLPPGTDPAIYSHFTLSLKARGRSVVVDASGEALKRAVAANPSVIKPNIHELETLVGKSLPDEGAIIDAARELVKGGIETVVVSMGEKGAVFVDLDEVIIARPPDLEIGSTVGAGDAMVAGIVVGLLRDLPLADCARLASAFSMHVLTRADGSISSAKAIETFLPQITIIGHQPHTHACS
jgi:1-phosphofructokinase